MDLGLRIKLFRVSAEKKQHEVARALSVSSNYVSMIERGIREPTLRFLRQFAEFIQIPTAILLLDNESKESDQRTQELSTKLLALMAEYAQTKGVSLPESTNSSQ